MLYEKKSHLIQELISEGILKSEKVIEAFKKVPRERFIPKKFLAEAYGNYPLPIDFGQTISQPLTVAAMTEALDVKKNNEVLEIGAGSGYQAAILSFLAKKVVTLERIKELYEFAKKNLADYKNVTIIFGDGTKGYGKEKFDRIIVTASAREVPKKLLEQLKEGGKMIIPVGNEMFLIEKKNGRIKKTFMGYYAFVPLVEDF